MNALGDLRVVDFSESIAGQYCTRLMSGYGADVVLVEPPEGSVIRRVGPFSEVHRDSLTFFHLNIDKRSVRLNLTATPGRAALLDLCRDADVILPHPGADLQSLEDVAPDAVICVINDFNPAGPYAGWKADEMIFQALSGVMYQNGRAGAEPLYGCGNRASYLTGVAAYISVLAALRNPGGEVVSLDAHTTAASATYHLANQYLQNKTSDRRDGPKRTPDLVMPCKDGWVAIFVYPYRWETFCRTLNLPHLAENPEFAVHADRLLRWDELAAAISQVTKSWAADNLVGELQRAGVPSSKCLLPSDLATSPHLVQRDYWRVVDSPIRGKRLAFGPPFRLADAIWTTNSAVDDAREAKKFDEKAETSTLGTAAPADVETIRAKPAPLANIRILDVTTAWAGPLAGRILASLGAEVVHVEAATRMDLSRGSPSGEFPSRYVDCQAGPRPYNRSIFFNAQNISKLSLSIDVKKPGGREALRAVADHADVILSNFTAGTLERMGLAYHDIARSNPRLIYLEMPAYGISGPMADYAALGPNMEFASGMSAFIGYGDGEPFATGPAYLDPLGGYNAAAAILTALHQRKRTARGQYIEISQCEAAMPMIGELILAALENSGPPQPMANELPGVPIHGAFPCRGEEEWIAMVVSGEDDWQNLLAVMNRPDLATDARFKNESDRLQHRSELKKIISEWTVSQDKCELAVALQTWDVAAAPVNSGKDVALDPQLRAIGFFSEIDHPDAGKRLYQGLPFAFSRSRLPPLRHAPLLGEHTEQVLKEWGEIDDTTITALFQLGTVSN